MMLYRNGMHVRFYQHIFNNKRTNKTGNEESALKETE